MCPKYQQLRRIGRKTPATSPFSDRKPRLTDVLSRFGTTPGRQLAFIYLDQSLLTTVTVDRANGVRIGA